MTSRVVSLKLYIDTKARKILYAEADKHFVDYLFYILSLPISSVVKLLFTDSTLGSLGILYNSINNLSNTYLQPLKDKSTILNPKLPILPNDIAPLILPGDLFVPKRFYTCCNYLMDSHIKTYVTDQSSSILCPECSRYNMTYELPYVIAPGKLMTPWNNECGGLGGFVKGDVTYMVTDDLEVGPLSTASSISVLSKFNVKDVTSIQEMNVQLGVAEGLKLLKAAFTTQSVLTTVFHDLLV